MNVTLWPVCELEKWLLLMFSLVWLFLSDRNMQKRASVCWFASSVTMKIMNAYFLFTFRIKRNRRHRQVTDLVSHQRQTTSRRRCHQPRTRLSARAPVLPADSGTCRNEFLRLHCLARRTRLRRLLRRRNPNPEKQRTRPRWRISRRWIRTAMMVTRRL